MRLYEANETEFNHNGFGVLSDAADAEVTEERNGAFELTIQYPSGGWLFSELKNRRIIYCPASAGDVLTLKQMAEALTIPFAETDGVITVGGMSSGDAAAFTQKADELGLPVQTATGMYVVQAGFFEKEGNANAFRTELSKKSVESAVVQADGGFRVQCGAFAKEENAQALVQQLAAKGVQTVLKEV